MARKPTWFEVDGDNTYALDWPLDSDSIVIEVGAYKGRWSQQIHERYDCLVLAFEPQHWAYTLLEEYADIHSRYWAYNYALGVSNSTLQMGEFETDACSFLPSGRIQGQGKMRRVEEVLAVDDAPCDLMMVNIEGYEYTLLPYMIEKGLLVPNKIARIVVQWHLFADPYHDNLKRITAHLDSHYQKLWSFFPTLEAWGPKA